MLEPSLEKISHYITSNNIALLSVIITVLLYIFTRHFLQILSLIL